MIESSSRWRIIDATGFFHEVRVPIPVDNASELVDASYKPMNVLLAHGSYLGWGPTQTRSARASALNSTLLRSTQVTRKS